MLPRAARPRASRIPLDTRAPHAQASTTANAPARLADASAPHTRAPRAVHWRDTLARRSPTAETVLLSNDATANTAESLPAPVPDACGVGINGYKGYVKVQSNYVTSNLQNLTAVIVAVSTGYEPCNGASYGLVTVRRTHLARLCLHQRWRPTTRCLHCS